MERSNLPEDLTEEILSTFPAKSLARWRSASKRWNARLKSEIFAKMQSSNAPNESSLIIMLMGFSVYIVKPIFRRIDSTVAPSITVTSQFYLTDPKFKSSQVDICDVFHCDGLFLCTTKDNRLVVWNPCSGETKWIKPRTRNHYKKSDCYALGYHNKSSCKQYKILRMYHQGGVYYEIYDFTTDSWRVLCTDPDGSTLLIGKCCGRVSMKGNTYWLIADTTSSYKLLLSFDFSTERFIRWPHTHQFPSSVETLSVVGDDQLCMCATSLTEIHIFVTRIRTGSAMSWREVYERNISCFKNCDFSNGASILAMEDNKLVLCFNNFIPADPHGENPTFISPCPHLLNYVPRLTRIQQGTRDL